MNNHLFNQIDFEKIPHSPGIYQFLDSDNNIIYIGKAKDLNKRVRSYFYLNNRSAKTEVLVKKIVDVSIIVVNNEVEALLLENNLIKKHKPKYNIVLKDSKTYAYIKITNEEYPRIETSRKILDDGSKYFGPYTDGFARREIIKLITQLYKIRTCRVLPKKPCLQYHLNLCDAPCIHKDIRVKYLENVDLAKNFLKGNVDDVLFKLKSDMVEFSKNERYELAKFNRDLIDKINKFFTSQIAQRNKDYDEDVLALINDDDKAVIILIHISKGLILSKKQFYFDYSNGLFQEFVKMYYSSVNREKIPKELIVNTVFWEDESEREVLEKYLSSLKGSSVKITYPKQGEKHRLVVVAEENAKLSLESPKSLIDLKDALKLETIPKIIECFDASNSGDDHIVVGMVRFTNAKPDLKEYRKFLIKTVVRQDDFASIYEAVFRRYSRLKEEGLVMPDLVIIDGGMGQLRSAIKALNDVRVDLNIVSLAKQNEEIYTSRGRILRFKKNSPMMLLIRQIRDATHNFALNYNKKRRSMKLRDDFKSIS